MQDKDVMRYYHQLVIVKEAESEANKKASKRK